MVTASKKLLRQVRKLAIKDEIVAMRLRGRLLVPQRPAHPATRPAGNG